MELKEVLTCFAQRPQCAGAVVLWLLVERKVLAIRKVLATVAERTGEQALAIGALIYDLASLSQHAKAEGAVMATFTLLGDIATRRRVLTSLSAPYFPAACCVLAAAVTSEEKSADAASALATAAAQLCELHLADGQVRCFPHDLQDDPRRDRSIKLNLFVHQKMIT